MRLTKDPYGEPRDQYESVAKQWLQQNNGTEGQPVMASLGALIRRAVERDRERPA